jgi:Kef-type K+ transport system membrane component KefB/Trk K+ transport system NAD-binding subunit
MEHSASPFVSLLIVAALAVIVPVTLRRFKRLQLPIVVGEILAGIIVGKSGLNMVSVDDPVIMFTAEFGLVFLMFLSGMEIDFSSLGLMNFGKTEDKKPFSMGPTQLAGLSFLLTLGLSIAFGFGLQKWNLVRDPWMMALILSTTSLGVVVPVLKESGLIGSRFGQAILVSALLADFVTMLLITVEVAILSYGLTLDILLIGVLFVAFFLIYRFSKFIRQIKGVGRAIEELSHATAQIKIRIAFMLMLVFVVLSEALGTEVILGAFLAGAILSLLGTSDDAHVAHELETFGYGFLIPIFFISVGVNFNLPVLFASSEALLLIPLLLGAAIVVKILPALLFKINFSGREALAAGTLLSARLSLIIAASAIGTNLGVISDAVNTSIILVAILTVTTAPLLFTRLMPRREREIPKHIVVVGAGSLGMQVARQLKAHNEHVVMLDYSEERVQDAQKRGFEAVLAEVEKEDTATETYLSKTQKLICLYPDVELNFKICNVAKCRFDIDYVVSQVSDPTDVLRFKQLGVYPMNAAMTRVNLLVMMARNPATYDLLTRTDDDKNIHELTIRGKTCIGKKLKHLSLPGDVLVMAMRRGGELIVPHGNTLLEMGDNLTLIGSNEHLEIAQQMFASTDCI